MKPQRIKLETRKYEDWIDISDRINAMLQKSQVESGVVTVYVPHTTAGVTIQENADPPLKLDINKTLSRLFPKEGGYQHCEDNASSHMKAVVVGPSVQIPFDNSRMLLGTWQSVYFCEFDGPRQREVVISISS